MILEAETSSNEYKNQMKGRQDSYVVVIFVVQKFSWALNYKEIIYLPTIKVVC